MSDSAEVVAQAFAEAINRQDVEGLTGLMTPGHRFIDALGGVTEGREKMRAAWVGYFRMVPDYSIVVDETYKAGPSTPPSPSQSSGSGSAQEVVVMLGKAGGTYAPDGQLKAENRWETPAAWRAVAEGGLVAEWRVYADNEPMRERMKRGLGTRE
jgi:hypothetical protein